MHPNSLMRCATETHPYEQPHRDGRHLHRLCEVWALQHQHDANVQDDMLLLQKYCLGVSTAHVYLNETTSCAEGLLCE